MLPAHGPSRHIIIRLPRRLTAHRVIIVYFNPAIVPWGKKKKTLYIAECPENLSVSTCAVIGQFSGPYSPARSSKFKVVFVSKLVRDLSPNFLN